MIEVPSNAAKLVHSIVGDNQVMANVIWLKRQAGDWTHSLSDAIATQWEMWVDDHWRSITGVQVGSAGIEILPGGGLYPKKYNWEAVMPGNGGTSTLPFNVTVCVSLRTQLTGRAGRGRLYHCGIPYSAVTGNRVTTLYVNNLVNAYVTLQATLLSLGVQWCVGSLISGGQPRAQVLLTPISAFRADNVLDSQRRRLPGRGT